MTAKNSQHNVEIWFWAKVDKEGPTLVDHQQLGPCWVWTASKNCHGYGHVWFNGICRQAHQVSWELSDRIIPDGLVIDHICHNRGCVNPAHLRLASRSENGRYQKLSRVNACGLKGVSWNSKDGKWRAQIKINRKSLFLGNFLTPEEAHLAYCSAADREYGEFACTG